MPGTPKPRLLIRLRRRMLRWLGTLALVVLVLRLTGCMERFFYYPESGPTPPPREFRGAESVWFTSKDGAKLHGWFIPAQTTPSDSQAKAATILHVHGNAGNITSHIGFTEFLPDAGFNLFIFDFRGYGQSEGSARRRAPLIDDTEAALDALLARPEVDPHRIGMFAQSLGGSIGLNVMADRPEIRAAVIESAFASWREEAACAVGGDPPGFLARALAWVCVSDSDRPDWAIAKIDRPILLLHGDCDGTIPCSQSRKLAQSSGGHATLIEFPGGDHNTLHETHPQSVQMIIDFFRKNLIDPAD